MPDTTKTRYVHDVHRSRNAVTTSLGARIRKLRERKRINQSEFAEYLGMNRGHLSDIELGKREARLLTLQAIAYGLDMTMSALLRGL